jgi:hypothetical protein
MSAGADRVVTNQSISDQQARRPVQEFTETVHKQGMAMPTQYVTQQDVRVQQEAPIRIKQQEVQDVQQKTVIQEQPVILKKQEVQIQKEGPVQVTHQSTQHQTLPTIEKKELYVQPVESSGMGHTTTNRTTADTGMTGTTGYQTGTTGYQAGTTGYNSSTTEGTGHRMVESMKEKAHNVMEKTRDLFHGSSHDSKVGGTTTSTTSTTGYRETPSS